MSITSKTYKWAGLSGLSGDLPERGWGVSRSAIAPRLARPALSLSPADQAFGASAAAFKFPNYLRCRATYVRSYSAFASLGLSLGNARLTDWRIAGLVPILLSVGFIAVVHRRHPRRCGGCVNWLRPGEGGRATTDRSQQPPTSNRRKMTSTPTSGVPPTSGFLA